MTKSIPKRKIEITVSGNKTLPLESLEPFQGSLKHLEKDEYEKLRKNLIEFGFSFVVHVWENEGKFHIIDGHQRIFTLSQMKKVEGWVIPDIPVALVSAKSFGEAKRKVLAAASQYGKVSKGSLELYLKENDIPYDELVSNFSFPEVDFSELADSFNQPSDPGIEDYEDKDEKTSASSSSQVKQIQLFFKLDDYFKFIEMVEDLGKARGWQNISDTLMEVVSESYKASNAAGA